MIFSTLWKSNITPWFDNLTYCDTKIEGVWQGILVPYMGIEEIDRLRMAAAWRRIMSEKKNEERQNSQEESVPIEASVIVDEGGKRTSTSAELILPSQNESKDTTNTESEKKPKTITIMLGAEPIRVRAEFWRVGHKIEGRFIEIGGASEVHTYSIEGTFRNLILCGRYENDNPQNIDRGSFSLMLKANGGKFEGFFASYADEQHKIHPFRCVLKRAPAGSEQ